MSSAKRVLIVEDHDDSRNVLVAMLRRTKFEATAYDRCEAAERHLEACDMDIALLDVHLPGKCGDDFGRELRERCPKTMIVFITAEAIIEPLKEKVPDCFVLRKPVDGAVLIELMECFCSDEGYSSSLKKETDQRAGPGHMG